MHYLDYIHDKLIVSAEQRPNTLANIWIRVCSKTKFGNQCCTYIPSADAKLTFMSHEMHDLQLVLMHAQSPQWDPFPTFREALGGWGMFLLNLVMPVLILCCFPNCYVPILRGFVARSVSTRACGSVQ